MTARSEESDRIRGLTTGADDYVVKPFSLPELMARVRAILRRTSPERIAAVLTAGDIELDRESHRVTRNGRQVHLGPTEFRLLEFLMQSPGRVFSRAQLLDGVWGRNVYVDERTVDVHIGRLRKAMMRGTETDPVRTVRGAGYAFSDKLQETFEPHLRCAPQHEAFPHPEEDRRSVSKVSKKEAPNGRHPSPHLTKRPPRSGLAVGRRAYRAAATAPPDRQAARDARNKEPSLTSCGRKNETPPRPDRRWASGTSLPSR